MLTYTVPKPRRLHRASRTITPALAEIGLDDFHRRRPVPMQPPRPLKGKLREQNLRGRDEAFALYPGILERRAGVIDVVRRPCVAVVVSCTVTVRRAGVFPLA